MARIDPTLYDSLKVTPDAPVEVIRAAYRALAALYHPDRHTGEQQAQQASHDEMAAINAAYTVLADPERRADYDAQLVTGYYGLGGYGNRARYAAAADVAEDSILPDETSMPRPAATSTRFEPVEEEDTGFSDTRVDIGWMTPPARAPRRSRRRETWVLGIVLTVVLALGLWVSNQQIERAQAEMALAAHLRKPQALPGVMAATLPLGLPAALPTALPTALGPSTTALPPLLSAASAPQALAALASTAADPVHADEILRAAPSGAGPLLKLEAPVAAASAAAATPSDGGASSPSATEGTTAASSAVPTATVPQPQVVLTGPAKEARPQ